MKKPSMFELGMIGLIGLVIFVAGLNIYLYIDETLVYGEIKDGVFPKEPYDKIDKIELFGQAIDGWYIANVFVVDSETNDFDNCMIRYNRDSKVFVIPSEQFGFDSCIEVKP